MASLKVSASSCRRIVDVGRDLGYFCRTVHTAPNLCPIWPVTRLTWAADTRPSFEASAASIVAILALRMTEGTGRPASFRLATGTSSG